MYARKVKAMAAFGETEKEISLDEDLAGNWQVYVGKMYYGMVIRYDRGFKMVFQNDSEHQFTSADNDAILELLGLWEKRYYDPIASK